MLTAPLTDLAAFDHANEENHAAHADQQPAGNVAQPALERGQLLVELFCGTIKADISS